ncbi:MAG TPA: 23S rRNA (adenine(2030)-N(6))-methyltransferase RlmJ [Steroidobacteraceae bacterium]
MKYRHSFHAGNFADVHKHVALLALLRDMQRKDKGFLYLDTHAGAGRYDLSGPQAHRGAESRHGIATLLAAAATQQAAEINDYRDAVAALRAEIGEPHAYPGSPWLAAHTLRAQDRGICWEILPSECRALERALGGFRRMRTECADGYQQLSAVLPSRERRCLLLIDPPYENPSAELDQALQNIASSLQRLANTVVLMWYPIKDERTLAPWLARVERALSAPTLSLELWIYPRDSRVGLNGSGLLLVNPPYQFEQRAALWQQQLHAVLDKARHGGSTLQWLVRESDVDHVGA